MRHRDWVAEFWLSIELQQQLVPLQVHICTNITLMLIITLLIEYEDNTPTGAV